MRRSMRRLGMSVLVVTLATGLSAGVAGAQAEKPAAGAAKPAATKPAKAPKAAKVKKASVNEVCQTDSAIYCDDDVRGGISKLACLRKNKDLVSADCASALGGR